MTKDEYLQRVKKTYTDDLTAERANLITDNEWRDYDENTFRDTLGWVREAKNLARLLRIMQGQSMIREDAVDILVRAVFDDDQYTEEEREGVYAELAADNWDT